MRPGTERLAGVALFSGLSPEDLEDVAGVMQLVSAPVGDVLTSETDDMKATFFVLLQGTVTVHRDGHHVADLGPGEVFGEAVSVAGQARDATVIVTTPAELGVVMGWDLRALLERLPSLRTRLDEIASSRSTGS
jgi:CRP/FNR family transcriptional regulator, cyclic AMP receptor protein